MIVAIELVLHLIAPVPNGKHDPRYIVNSRHDPSNYWIVMAHGGPLRIRYIEHHGHAKIKDFAKFSRSMELAYIIFDKGNFHEYIELNDINLYKSAVAIKGEDIF